MVVDRKFMEHKQNKPKLSTKNTYPFLKNLIRKFLNSKSCTNSKVKFLMKSRGRTAMICRVCVFYIANFFSLNYMQQKG